jgi:hypothetical protein
VARQATRGLYCRGRYAPNPSIDDRFLVSHIFLIYSRVSASGPRCGAGHDCANSVSARMSAVTVPIPMPVDSRHRAHCLVNDHNHIGSIPSNRIAGSRVCG